MNQKNRDYFDQQVEWVLERLPQSVIELLQEVPLHVEDQPPEQLMQQLGLSDAEELCGYFYGVPLGAESQVFGATIYDQPRAPIQTSVTLFRLGIAAESRDEEGRVNRSQLRRQIRITILHELAHLHGMDEEEIDALGYG